MMKNLLLICLVLLLMQGVCLAKYKKDRIILIDHIGIMWIMILLITLIDLPLQQRLTLFLTPKNRIDQEIFY